MNIFENAKFGDKFRTRDGRMAIYNGRSIDRYWLIVERHPWNIIGFNSCGRHSGLEEDIDIISEWQEPINIMTRNDYIHPVVIIYRDGQAEGVMGFYTFKEHGFYQNLVCKDENIKMSDLNDCGDNRFKSEVSDKKWTRHDEIQNALVSMFQVEPTPEPVYTFHFDWIKMSIEEVEKYKNNSFHDEN